MSALSPDRWREISPHLDHALSLDEKERAAWLESFATENPALADLLRELLLEHSLLAREKFLETAPEPPGTESSLAGQRIGAYTLLSPIGQGGMGSVWLAERSDGRFERRVAIKFLHFSVAAQGGVGRFKREGSILGQLTHPNIAELLDAGVTPSGEPYLVLEYVEGEPLTDYCDRHALDVNSRIRLFLDVLSAVAHAHANLVVHRDLKPSNVLVRKDGKVKLLDFGIAKLLSADASPAEATLLTVEGGAALTPHFAAPEQVLGNPITTATDVYSLGVLLYLSLTGQHPAGVASNSPADLLRAIVDTQARRASSATTSASSNAVAENRGTTVERLSRQLRGDLDTILAKSLKKSAAERYVSVDAFADDLKRYLKHETISARPDSFTYTARKFIRRNRLGVGLSALALVAIIAGATGTFLQARSVRRQRDFAFRQLLRAEKINDLNHFLLTDTDSGKSLSPDELLGRAERVVRHETYSADPAHHVEMLVSIGSQYCEKEEYDKALPILEDAYQLSRHVKDASARARAACAFALPLYRQNQFARAESLIEEGLRELPNDPQFALDRASCLSNGVQVASWGEDDKTAMARALSAESLFENSPYATDYQKFRSLWRLSAEYQEAAEGREHAIRSLDQAYALLRKLGYDGTETEVAILTDLGHMLLNAGRVLEAEEKFHRAVSIEGTLNNQSFNPILLNGHARALVMLGRPQDGLPYAMRAYELAKDSDKFIADQSLTLIASSYLERHEISKAASALSKAETAMRRDYPPDAFQIKQLLYGKSLVLQAEGNLAGAQQLITQVISSLEAGPLAGPGSGARILLPRLLVGRSGMEFEAGAVNQAQADAEQAVSLIVDKARPGTFSCYAGKAYMAMGRALKAQGKSDAARSAFSTAAQHFQKTLGAGSPETKAALEFAKE